MDASAAIPNTPCRFDGINGDFLRLKLHFIHTSRKISAFFLLCKKNYKKCTHQTNFLTFSPLFKTF